MELEITVTVAFILWFSANFQSLRRTEEGSAKLSEMEFALSSVQDIPFSPRSAIYSVWWNEFLLFHKDLRASAASHYLSTRLLAASIRHFERVWSDRDWNYLASPSRVPREVVSIMLRIIMFQAWFAQCTFWYETFFTRDQINHVSA